MQGTQLYDANSNPIYPSTYARNVESGVVVGGNTVYEDLSAILNLIQSLRAMVNGSAEVSNSLQVKVNYALSNSNTGGDGLNYEGNESFIMPTPTTPYTWQKMEFFWGSDSVKTVYSIVATALYPETQVMYTTINSINQGLQGPSDYGDNMPDMGLGNSSVIWNSYFNGISGGAVYGYMAVRHREAGQSFPVRQDDNSKPQWKVALFAQYPTTGS